MSRWSVQANPDSDGSPASVTYMTEGKEYTDNTDGVNLEALEEVNLENEFDTDESPKGKETAEFEIEGCHFKTPQISTRGSTALWIQDRSHEVKIGHQAKCKPIELCKSQL